VFLLLGPSVLGSAGLWSHGCVMFCKLLYAGSLHYSMYEVPAAIQNVLLVLLCMGLLLPVSVLRIIMS